MQEDWFSARSKVSSSRVTRGAGQHAVALHFDDVHRYHGDGRSGVPAHRFKDLDPHLNPVLAQLLGGKEPVLIVANHDWGLRAGHALRTQRSVLEKRVAARECEKLLWQQLAGKWPQSGS